ATIRVARVMETGSQRHPGPLNASAAEDAMQQADREWTGYIRYMFGANMLDPLLYDVVLATDRLSAAGAVDQLVALAQRPEFQSTAPSLQRVADLALSSRAEVALTRDRKSTRLNSS